MLSVLPSSYASRKIIEGIKGSDSGPGDSARTSNWIGSHLGLSSKIMGGLTGNDAFGKAQRDRILREYAGNSFLKSLLRPLISLTGGFGRRMFGNAAYRKMIPDEGMREASKAFYDISNEGGGEYAGKTASFGGPDCPSSPSEVSCPVSAVSTLSGQRQGSGRLSMSKARDMHGKFVSFGNRPASVRGASYLRDAVRKGMI